MYIGRYYHRLEAKNRMSLPASFRKILGESGVITRGLDGCLNIFDGEHWQKQIEKIQNLSETKKANREYMRHVTNDAVEIDIDGQGRILISEDLKEAAGLVKEIVCVGSLTHIEIWDRDRYAAYVDKTEKVIEDTVETIEDGNS
ncbi:MAG TPA: division/cell wall cluster transcriptional repressor MraZ [Patescibacteria group bacterium]|nr:division/cell wall cluster transcriptional repressor MraZ [Patescibacteria group bacterium]